jgi:hypothetical protein
VIAWLGRILGIPSPAERLLEQVAAASRNIDREVSSFAKGFERAQLAAGQDPSDPAAADLRHKAAAAYCINRLYEISNPTIGKRRDA